MVLKYSHERVVHERPLARPLQHVVEEVLQPAVGRVPAAALRAVDQRLPEQAEPRALLPLPAARRTCGAGGRQQTVRGPRPVVVHRPAAGLHILRRVLVRPASSGALQPETLRAAAALVAGVTSRRGIATSAAPWETGRHSHGAQSALAPEAVWWLLWTFTAPLNKSGG